MFWGSREFEFKVSDCFCVDLQGCASWEWYFPFHYAPFASDFKDIKEMFTDFEMGTKPVRIPHSSFFCHFRSTVSSPLHDHP